HHCSFGFISQYLVALFFL
ncbi:hypothetical protein D049_3038B, partial [Vibrio parahaemolyticus VPTS-2010]